VVFPHCFLANDTTIDRLDSTLRLTLLKFGLLGQHAFLKHSACLVIERYENGLLSFKLGGDSILNLTDLRHNVLHL